MGDEIDRLLAAIEEKKRQFDSEIATCKREMDLGRTGLDAYLRAKSLQAELAKLAALAGVKIDEALKAI